MTLDLVSTPGPGEPQWIERAFSVKPGRDPLGLQTITMDRIMPRLVPSILGLTRRARYFSFYAYLLSEYETRRMDPSSEGLSAFIKAREFEYALAVLNCPRKCFDGPGGKPIGTDRATPAIRSGGESFERGESVKSHLGGYGLYYRTPMAELGVAVRAGTQLGERSTPIDVLARAPRAIALAESFRDGLSKTEYGAHYVRGINPIPQSVLAGYSASMCLCGLSQSPAEQSQLRAAILGKWEELPPAETEQRRVSFAYVLHLVSRVPEIATSESTMREEMWRSFEIERHIGTSTARVAAQWGALIAKDIMQDAISSIWKDLCELGLARQSGEGLTPNELEALLTVDLVGTSPLVTLDRPIEFSARMATRDFAATIVGATEGQTLEVIRNWANAEARAIAGVALLLILYSRLRELGEPPPGWAEIALQRSERQPGLAQLGRELDEHLKSDPSLAETLWWISRRLIIAPHEVIAYSKLPDFTFRFRWENGRLRFYPYDRGRFEVTDIRRDSILQISRDLGFWHLDGSGGVLTGDGRQFVREVLDVS